MTLGFLKGMPSIPIHPYFKKVDTPGSPYKIRTWKKIGDVDPWTELVNAKHAIWDERRQMGRGKGVLDAEGMKATRELESCEREKKRRKAQENAERIARDMMNRKTVAFEPGVDAAVDTPVVAGGGGGGRGSCGCGCGGWRCTRA